MRVKVPDTIMAFPKGEHFIIYNYLSKVTAMCEARDMFWLTVAPEWINVDQIIAGHPDRSASEISGAISQLIQMNLLLVEGTHEAEQEQEFSRSWELGPQAAMYHFAVQDVQFMSLAQSIQAQKVRSAEDKSPELFWLNMDNVVHLTEPQDFESSALTQVMSKRRSNRSVENEPVTMNQLSKCLYSGFGITGFVKTETAVLPLKMTPSGGARNPFEAFVWAKNVEGLTPGIYHYSALQHSLETVQTNFAYSATELFTGQDWTEQMPAVIFLVASLGRTSWKYSDPTAYRVVLIEAGHIAQNILLACAENDLTGCPTAALSHSRIRSMLGLKRLTDTPVYAITIGKPSAMTDQIIPVETIQKQILSDRAA